MHDYWNTIPFACPGLVVAIPVLAASANGWMNHQVGDCTVAAVTIPTVLNSLNINGTAKYPIN